MFASPRSIIRPGFRLRPAAALTGVIALVTAVAACENGPPAPVLEDGAALVLGVEVDGMEILPGDTLWVTVRAENRTAARVVVPPFCGSPLLTIAGAPGASRAPTDVPVPLAFSVRSAAGEELNVGQGGAFCLRPPPRPEVEPGGALEALLPWDGRSVGGNVAAGDYEIRGVLRQGPGRPVHESDPVGVRVLPMLTLRVRAEPGSPEPGDEVTVTVELRNETPGPLVTPTLSSCRFAVWVRGESARPDVLTECPAEPEETVLASGAVAGRTLRWTPEAAGTYGVFAELFAREIQPQIRDSLTVRVGP